jgi:hypothetical protein
VTQLKATSSLAAGLVTRAEVAPSGEVVPAPDGAVA